MPPKKKNNNSKPIPSEMDEVNKRVNQLETEFSRRLSKFKEELLGQKPSDGANLDFEDILNRFQQFEKTIMEEINTIKVDVSQKLSELEYSVDTNTQRAYNKCLLIHGVSESEEIYPAVLNLFSTKLKISIDKSVIADCYRLGKKDVGNKKQARPIVVEFVHKYERDNVFYKKRVLKGTKIVITELLTRMRLQILQKCQSVYKQQCWTSNGNIIVMDGEKKVFISNRSDMKKYLNID